MAFQVRSTAAPDRHTSYFWHPKAHPAALLAEPPRRIASAEGVHITDSRGARLLDAAAGLWNVNLGYSAEPIKKAIASQLDVLPYFSSFGGLTHGPAEELARTLIEDWFAEEGMRRAFFTSGGSDSVETALRLARQYWKVVGTPERTKYISLRRGYHGTHFGGDSVSGGTTARRSYEPLLPGCFHVPAPLTYRNPFDITDPELLAEACARALEEEIRFQGPETVAAFIAEPVMGAGGVIVPPASFWPRVRAICDKYEILLIADEVVTAFGRSGFECGSRGWRVKPDIMCTAKAITCGYFPLGATLVNARITQAFESTTEIIASISHGYTYSAHPVGCAAAIAALRMTKEAKVWENAALRGSQLMLGLEKLKQKHLSIGDVRGKGLMAGIEVVTDRHHKTPAGKTAMTKILDASIEKGVMVRGLDNIIILSPPLIVDSDNVDEIIDALDHAFAVATN
jgi:adenosylmethionine-8-amino-7-oxononanoate aminotransferase